MRFFEGKYDPREGRVERHGKPRAGAARQLIPSFHIGAPEQFARPFPACRPDKHARSFAACGKPRKHGQQACRSHSGKRTIPFQFDQSSRRSFRLRNAASARHGNELGNRRNHKRNCDQRKKKQRNPRGIFPHERIYRRRLFHGKFRRKIKKRDDHPDKKTGEKPHRQNLNAALIEFSRFFSHPYPSPVPEEPVFQSGRPAKNDRQVGHPP